MTEPLLSVVECVSVFLPIRPRYEETFRSTTQEVAPSTFVRIPHTHNKEK